MEEGPVEGGLGLAPVAHDDGGDVLDRQFAAIEVTAFGQELPGERERVGDDLAEVADAHGDPLDRPPVRVGANGVANRLR
jgi:hypothetical protein